MGYEIPQRSGRITCDNCGTAGSIKLIPDSVAALAESNAVDPDPQLAIFFFGDCYLCGHTHTLTYSLESVVAT